jgi:SOS-response transcriptional repressor LexA
VNSEVRPSKKQRELLSFIEAFIAQHGYGPSYREIMNGVGYRSVSTVATHVDNLIKKGHLRKRDYSARSLEVVSANDPTPEAPKVTAAQEKWLVNLVDRQFVAMDQAATPSQKQIDEAYVLVGALKVLGFAEAARAFTTRLLALNKLDIK